MAKFKVEAGIPIPPRSAKLGARKDSKYPFARMEVGDSFFIPTTGPKDPAYKRLLSSVSQAKRRFGINLQSRVVDGGVRVWRLEDLASCDLAGASQ